MESSLEGNERNMEEIDKSRGKREKLGNTEGTRLNAILLGEAPLKNQEWQLLQPTS